MESTNELEQLLQEPPHGPNSGYRPADTDDTRIGLSTAAQASVDFMQGGGFGTVDTSAGTHTGTTYGYQDMGLSVHRGTLHPDEYVHHDKLINMLERHFGFSFDEIRSVLTRGGGPGEPVGGPLPKALRELRARIDARILELHTADSFNIDGFAKVVGTSHMSIHRALRRARKATV